MTNGGLYDETCIQMLLRCISSMWCVPYHIDTCMYNDVLELVVNILYSVQCTEQ